MAQEQRALHTVAKLVASGSVHYDPLNVVICPICHQHFPYNSYDALRKRKTSSNLQAHILAAHIGELPQLFKAIYGYDYRRVVWARNTMNAIHVFVGAVLLALILELYSTMWV